MTVTVRIDQGRLQRMLQRAGGPGDRLLRRKAERVAAAARVNAAGHGSIPEGIIVGPVEGKTIKVISTNIHSLLVHQGSPRHFIRPRNPKGYLRFEQGGVIRYAKVVNHPGYVGDPYLRKALSAI